MSLKTEAYVVAEKGAPLVLKEITLPPLKANEVCNLDVILLQSRHVPLRLRLV